MSEQAMVPEISFQDRSRSTVRPDCPVCGKKLKRGQRKYCSTECVAKSRRKQQPLCAYCHKKPVRGKGYLYCGRACAGKALGPTRRVVRPMCSWCGLKPIPAANRDTCGRVCAAQMQLGRKEGYSTRSEMIVGRAAITLHGMVAGMNLVVRDTVPADTWQELMEVSQELASIIGRLKKKETA